MLVFLFSSLIPLLPLVLLLGATSPYVVVRFLLVAVAYLLAPLSPGGLRRPGGSFGLATGWAGFSPLRAVDLEKQIRPDRAAVAREFVASLQLPPRWVGFLLAYPRARRPPGQ